MIRILIAAEAALSGFVLLLPFLYTVSLVGIITCVIIILTTILDLRCVKNLHASLLKATG